MAEISVQTANKQAITRTITSSLRSNIDPLTDRINAVLFPEGVPARVDTRVLLLAVADLIDRDYRVVADHDREVAKERGEDTQARASRDSQVATLRESLFRARNLVSAAHGEANISACGLGGRIPDDAESLVSYARNAAKQLATMKAPATAPLFVAVDLGAVAGLIQQQADGLDTALTTLARELRETQTAQGNHNNASATWQKHYQPVASIIEASFLLAEMDHQADRVRPTNRRRTGRAEPIDLQPDEPPASGETSPGNGAGDEHAAAAAPAAAPAPAAATAAVAATAPAPANGVSSGAVS